MTNTNNKTKNMIPVAEFGRLNMVPTLLVDWYKVEHFRQYPEGTEVIYSTFTPRSNKHAVGMEKVVFFGLQYYIKNILLGMFNEEFFNLPKEEAIARHERIVKNSLGNAYTKHIGDLHDLGYLPIEIKALPEGTVVPMQVPMLTITNTHPDFFWLTNMLETSLSNALWYPSTTAAVSYQFRKHLEKYANIIMDNLDGMKFLMHDFSMRGISSLESAMISGSSHLLSFVGEETVPATMFLEGFYNANVEEELISSGIAATEHSVMSANSPLKVLDIITMDDIEDPYELKDKLAKLGFPNEFLIPTENKETGRKWEWHVTVNEWDDGYNDFEYKYDTETEPDLAFSYLAKEYSYGTADQYLSFIIKDDKALIRPDEYDTYKRLLTKVYPNGPLSIVSDTYDFWKVVTETIPSLKEEILNRDGFLSVRPDSGDPADVLCGTLTPSNFEFSDMVLPEGDNRLKEYSVKEIVDYLDSENTEVEVLDSLFNIYGQADIVLDITEMLDIPLFNKLYYNKFDEELHGDDVITVRHNGEYIDLLIGYSIGNYNGDYDYIVIEGVYESKYSNKDARTVEEKGLIETLWEIFGGTVNKKGYKVLDSHIRAIYGDSITPDRALDIYQRLEKKGFSIENVVLASGSYAYTYLTRDTFGMAMKATHSVINGEEVPLMKLPKTDSGKASQRGVVYVTTDVDGELTYQDNLTLKEYEEKNLAETDLLQPVFKDGELLRETSLSEIRAKIDENVKKELQ